jgi:N-acetylglucosamine-6-sulfatase
MKQPSSQFQRLLFLTVAATLLVALVAAWTSGTPASPPRVAASARVAPPPKAWSPTQRPNVVFVLTDDLSWNLVRFMPEVRRMQQHGATFSNYFVTSSLCCSSRTSIFTGEYPHNTHVLGNTPPNGGFMAFRRHHIGGRTFAAGLSRAGYRTAFLGKYLNGYRAAPDRPAPHWNLWFANGLGYKNFNYSMRFRDSSRSGPVGSQRGRLLHFGWKPRDYMVDVIRRRSDAFIRANASRPFFMELSTFTPHLPTVAAPRDRHRFTHLPLPRGGSFNQPVTDAPWWLARHTPLRPHYIRKLRREWRRRARSVLAIVAMLRSIRRTLEAKGIADRTYVVFSSDNGYHLGEHRLRSGKRTAFDHDVKVPLIGVGPGVPPRADVPELTANIDLAPTFAGIAGAQPPARADGVSLLGLLHGRRPATWRDQLLMEYYKPAHSRWLDPDASDDFVKRPPTYHALRTEHALYVEDRTGEREFYDLTTDPLELHNRYASLPKIERVRLHWRLRGLATCKAAACRQPPPP